MKSKPSFKTIIGFNTNAELTQLAGLYEGDGLTSTKSKTSRGSFAFGNIELALNSFVIESLENLFNLNRTHLKFQVQVREDAQKDQAINFWSERLSLPKENFRKTMINKLQRSKHGLLSIIYENKAFKDYFMFTLNKIKKLAEKNKLVAIEYLKGIIASDGDVGLEKNGSLSRVRISGATFLDLRHYQRVLKILRISSSITEKNRLQISNWKNLFKIADFNLVSLHPEKKRVFFSGFRKHRKLKLFQNLTCLKNKPITLKDYQNFINTKYNTTAIRQLNKFVNLDMVSKEKKGVFAYQLLERGNLFLKIIEDEKRPLTIREL